MNSLIKRREKQRGAEERRGGSSSLIGCYVVGLCLCLFYVGAVYADQRIQVDVNPTTGTLNDTFLMTVKVAAEDMLSQPELFGSNDFKVSYLGPESNIQIINGHVESSIRYRYALRPKKTGTLSSPGARIKIGGKTFAAKPLQIEVGKGLSGSQAQFKQPVFLLHKVDKQKVYVGEQVVNTLELYSALKLREPQADDVSFDGFWVQTLGKNQHYRRQVKGRVYQVVRSQKALFPLSSGTLSVPQREMQVLVREPSRNLFDRFDFGMDPLDDPFGGFGFGRLREVRVQGDPIDLEVLPLPPLPKDLSSRNTNRVLVGDTNVAISFNADPIEFGASKTLDVVVSSVGNLNQLKQLALELPAGIKVYQQKPETQSSVRGKHLFTRKSFKFSLVPQHGGEISIPAVRIIFFDPEAEQYQIARSNDVKFLVKGGPTKLPQEQTAQSLPAELPSYLADSREAKTDSTDQQNQLRYTEPTWLESMSKQISTSLALLIIAALLATGTLIWWLLRLRKSNQPLNQMRKQIRSAESLEELAESYRHYLSKSLRLDAVTSSSEQLKAQLREKVSKPDLQLSAQSLLDEFDTLRFSGSGANIARTELARLRDKALEVCRGLR